jgi:uncharacterized membrane protein YgcG
LDRLLFKSRHLGQFSQPSRNFIMSTYSSIPVKAAKPASPGTNSGSFGIITLILLVASLAVGGYAWNDLHTKVNTMQLDLSKLKAQVATASAAAQRGLGGGLGGGGFGGGGGGFGGGGRRGGNITAIIQNLGLDDATAAQLTDLGTQRTAAVQAAQLDAQNQGINRRQDPDAYQAILDAATSAIDAKIGAISPDALAAMQQQGGRRGGGGGFGGGGGGGFGGGGPGGGAGGAADPNAGN